MGNIIKAIGMIENKETRPEVDHRLAEIFGKLGFLEGRMEEIEKKTTLNANNQIQLEKELFNNIKDLKDIVNNIDKQLFAASLLDKERQEQRLAQATERREMDKLKREEKKTIYSILPAVVDGAYKILLMLGIFWGIFEYINSRK